MNFQFFKDTVTGKVYFADPSLELSLTGSQVMLPEGWHETAKQSLVTKLKALGFTDEEVSFISGWTVYPEVDLTPPAQ